MVFLLSLEVWVIVIALLPALIPERIFGPDGSFFLGAFASMVGAAFLAWAFYKTTLKWLRIGPGEYPNPPPPGEALPQDGPG
jgi:hypothetical protein